MNLGFPGILARSDYLVEGRHTLLAMLTASKQNRREGRGICCPHPRRGRHLDADLDDRPLVLACYYNHALRETPSWRTLSATLFTVVLSKIEWQAPAVNRDRYVMRRRGKEED